jgi:hypothetical protein
LGFILLFKISLLALRVINLNLKIMDAIGGIVGLLIGITIVVLIIWAIRELLCWYWKINQIVKIQQAMLEATLKIYEQNGGKVNWDEVNNVIK